jgi:hypothetical protein
MTDATGRSFISYRRSRAAEAALLVAAQHDHGIPTWHDLKDLEEVPTGDALHEVLRDPFTASALLWITPDVKDSDVIRKIEVPHVLRRASNRDGFFLVPVCAGGTTYQTAADAVDQQLSADVLSDWNLPRVTCDPISAIDAAAVAARVLSRRVRAVHAQTAPSEPFKITIQTRVRPPIQPGTALTIDWCGRFAGREAASHAWQEHLLPALGEIVRTVQATDGNRPVVVSGLACLPAVVALGAAFLATGGRRISWNQYTPGRGEQLWNLDAARESAGFTFRTAERDVSGNDLAVLVSVNDDVEPAFAQTPTSTLPAFRAIARVSHPECPRFDITSGGLAVDIAMTVVEAIRDARRTHRPLSTIHLFMAVPTGLAMLIGQLLNTFGPVQTYEHISNDGVGVYVQAALLRPSA